jgi:hypothetical protein
MLSSIVSEAIVLSESTIKMLAHIRRCAERQTGDPVNSPDIGTAPPEPSYIGSNESLSRSDLGFDGVDARELSGSEDTVVASIPRTDVVPPASTHLWTGFEPDVGFP